MRKVAACAKSKGARSGGSDAGCPDKGSRGDVAPAEDTRSTRASFKGLPSSTMLPARVSGTPKPAPCAHLFARVLARGAKARRTRSGGEQGATQAHRAVQTPLLSLDVCHGRSRARCGHSAPAELVQAAPRHPRQASPAPHTPFQQRSLRPRFGAPGCRPAGPANRNKRQVANLSTASCRAYSASCRAYLHRIMVSVLSRSADVGEGDCRMQTRVFQSRIFRRE